MIKLPSQEEIMDALNYDKDTGVLTWKKRQRVKEGAPAGTKTNNNGYIRLAINGKQYSAHRVAWVYHYGSIDENMQVDHINGIRNDNRICNLRLVSHKENHKNKKLTRINKAGFNGVRFNEKKKSYVASIKVDGNMKYLGSFKKIEDAISARKKANSMYGFHENHGAMKNES